MTPKSTVIIGSGLGGLLCGAILSRHGIRCTVLEKDTVAGGCLQSFTRNGISYETGFHTIGGLQTGQLPQKLMTYLGIWEQIRPHLLPLDADGSDEVYIGNRHYVIASGRQGFTDSLSRYFPEERQHIADYVEEVFRLCDQLPVFNLQASPSGMTLDTLISAEPIGKMITRHISNPDLQELLIWNSILYGGCTPTTPALIAALLTRLTIDHNVRFKGGTAPIAEALMQRIREQGGQILTRQEVTRIHVQEKRVTAVETKNGELYRADQYIFDLHPADVISMLPGNAFPKAYRQRLLGLRNTYSLFTLFIAFKPERFPYLNRNIYVADHPDAVWRVDPGTDPGAPPCMMILTPPAEGENRFAGKMIVHCAMYQDAVRSWNGTSPQHRPPSYIRFKEQCTERIMERLRRIFPEIDQAVAHFFAATPLTLQHYLSLYDGAIYGTAHQCQDLYASYLSTRTKLTNLLLTGQSVRLHGMCGVSATAVETCAQLVGLDSLLHSIMNS